MRKFITKRHLSLSVSSAALAAGAVMSAVPLAHAQDTDDGDTIIVTGTRREGTVQDVPINIAAVGAQQIEEQGIGDLAEIVGLVPGVFIVDQGSRAADRIVVRGLNADPLGSSEGLGNGGGGIVATYLGEIPLYVDLKLNDMERVEFLLGPQGTLYGAGTMGGAIRYIPKKPDFSSDLFSVRGETYGYSEADGLSYEVGATFNAPISDTFAIRASVDYLDDTGFIDYLYVVDEIGVSNPDPDFSDPDDVAANTHKVKDANGEETISGRVAARWMPTDAVDATLTYYFQSQESEGRTISHRRGLIDNVGEYEATLRVEEPNERVNQLLSLEVIADLGWAELTSATGYSRYDEEGNRDQTDLLIGLEYSYEGFPSFTAITLEEQTDKTFTQEVRLVSQYDSPISWIAGAFYNDLQSEGSSKEFTPGYADYVGGSRPDALEYFSVGEVDLKEAALFGEVTWQITDAWQVTLGTRYYEYELETRDAVDFPLLFSAIIGSRGPDEIVLDFEEGGQEDDGFLYKFNTSYEVSDDVLVYGTVSQGYRIGNSNGVAPCPDPLPSTQIACALPFEMQYFPDETTNYEVGFKSQLFDNRLTLNAAAFYIDWKDPQVSSATVNASIPITINGSGAETKGIEMTFDAALTDQFSLAGSYGYSKAELTDPVPDLLPFILPPGFTNTLEAGCPTAGDTLCDDGREGDRLPGSPEHQYSLIADYEVPLSNGTLNFNYYLRGASSVLTRTGGRAMNGNVTLDGYSLSNVSATYRKEDWSATLYVENLYDEYVETAIRSTPLSNQVVLDDSGDDVIVRSYFANVLPPRSIGVRFKKDF